MEKATPLKYTFSVNEKYVSVFVSGHYSLLEAKRMYVEALDVLVKTKLSKLFFDVLNVKGNVSTVDRYYLGEYAAIESLKYMKKGLDRITVSFYGTEPIIDSERFGELVARNLGLNLKVTMDKSESFRFLGI